MGGIPRGRWLPFAEGKFERRTPRIESPKIKVLRGGAEKGGAGA